MVRSLTAFSVLVLANSAESFFRSSAKVALVCVSENNLVCKLNKKIIRTGSLNFKYLLFNRLVSEVLCAHETFVDLIVFISQDLQLVLPLIITGHLFGAVFDHHLDFFCCTIIFVVIFILQGQEMFVKRDSVTEESLIPRGLILLVDLTLLQKLDLSFVCGYLSLEVLDELKVEIFASVVSRCPILFRSRLIGRLLKGGVALEFLVSDVTSLGAFTVSATNVVNTAFFGVHAVTINSFSTSCF